MFPVSILLYPRKYLSQIEEKRPGPGYAQMSGKQKVTIFTVNSYLPLQRYRYLHARQRYD